VREGTHPQYLERGREGRERESTHTQYLLRQARECTRTHTMYFTERERTHTIYFTERGDNAKNIPMRAHTHTIYFTESARTRTHTPHIFYRKRAHTIYFTGEETMHKTFLCAHTHRNHPSQIQNAMCVRRTFFNHCCVSSAAAQKQGICKM
jgi:hypothetical protein